MNTTVIITIYKRNHLSEQLNSLISQTVPPTEIWILQNGNFQNVDHIVSTYKKKFPSIYLFKSEVNLKFHGRYCLANNIKTAFTWILDDDVIPGREWHSKCYRIFDERDCVVCPTGRIIPPNDYQPELCRSKDYKSFFIGDCYNDFDYNYCPEQTIVDYGCNSYFFKTEYIQYFWKIWPYSFELGDDIHLSATLKIQMALPTIVLSQTNLLTSGNQRKTYGFDSNASFRDSRFIIRREEILKYLVNERRWRPILW